LQESFSGSPIYYTVGDGLVTQEMPTFTQNPDCGYEFTTSIKGMPNGATFEDNTLSVDIEKEELVGGYTVEFTAICDEAPK